MRIRLEEIAATKKKAFAMGPFGSRIKSENYKSVGVPIIRGTNLCEAGGSQFIDKDYVFLSPEKANELSASRAFPSDLVFVAQGTVGKVGLIPNNSKYKEFILSQNIMKVSLDITKADPRFVYFYFSSNEGQGEIQSYVNPTGVPCISQPLSSLKKFSIPFLPELSTQKAIAHILGTLDDKIELLYQMNETLEAMARALFKSWFIDFDPVRKKAEGKPTGLPPEIDKLFPDSFVDSELGEIPKGWEVKHLSEKFDIIMGQSPPGDTYNQIGEGLPFYQGKTDFTFRYPKQRIFCSNPKRTANEGDTLVSVRAPVGDMNMAEEKCCIGRGVASVRHNQGYISYTYYHLNSIREEFYNFEAEGTVFGSINQKDFNRIKSIHPSTDLVISFERNAIPIDSLIKVHSEELILLTKKRDSLLPKLISGELEIKDIDKILEPAS